MSNIANGKPTIKQDDIDEVQKILKSGWLTTGPMVQKFEEEFARKVGSKYAIAVNSGTAALDLAVAVLGIDEGEIITTPFTFVATVNAILYNNLKPIFVDIKKDTFNINPRGIRKAITDKTKAIIYVDYAGQPCEIDEIKKIAKENNLLLIEDAAHGLGAEYKGNKIGSLADLTTFSFHPVKNITTGEGGMITTNNEEYYQKLLILRNHGLDKTDKSFGGAWSMNLKELGRNYRLTDFQCALGITQLNKLEMFNQRREEIAKKYIEAFKDNEEITLPKLKDNVKHSWHIFTILLNTLDRNEFFTKLQEKGVNPNVHYIPIYKFDYYKKIGLHQELDNVEEVFLRIVTLPMHYEMSNEDVDHVIKSVKEVIINMKVEKK